MFNFCVENLKIDHGYSKVNIMTGTKNENAKILEKISFEDDLRRKKICFTVDFRSDYEILGHT